MYGEGNAYTAAFWEYDSRIGRRWNLDPVIKPWRSSYDAFDNNPIWKLDPNGADDFFNADGTHSHSDNKKTANVYIMTDKGNVLFGDYQMQTVHDMDVIENVVNYYADRAGVIGHVGVNMNYDDPSSPASTEPSTNLVNINGYFNRRSEVNDANVIENILKHENFHQLDFLADADTEDGEPASYTFEKHSIVYIKAFADESFGKASKSCGDCMSGYVGSLAEYIMNAYVQQVGGPAIAEKLVEDFNNTNLGGYKMTLNPPSQTSLFPTMSIQFKDPSNHKVTHYEPIEYEPKKDAH